jgi:deoxyribonuclease-4
MAAAFNEIYNHPIGIHVSISGKLDQSVDRAVAAGCVGTFQIFTCSPRQWIARQLKQVDVESFRAKVSEQQLRPFAHMPYLPNLSSPRGELHSKSVKVLKREIDRCEQLGIAELVLHFGSHMGTSIESGQSQIIDACNNALHETSNSHVRLLLENSAGVKNSVGSEFLFISRVLDELADVQRVGVCFDTCHAFAAGYDLRTEDKVHETLSEFDEKIGLEHLRLIHLNDSKGSLGDGLDRHEHIGEGKIGPKGISAILRAREIANIPVILETPIEKEGDDKLDILRAKKLMP